MKQGTANLAEDYCFIHKALRPVGTARRQIAAVPPSNSRPADMSFHYLLYTDRSYSMGSAGINSELEIKLDKCPISTAAVKFPIFARICHTI